MQWRRPSLRTRSPDWRVIAIMAFAASLLSEPDSFRGAPDARASLQDSLPGATNDGWSRPLQSLTAISQQLAKIDDLVGAALADGKLPGCVVVVGQHDRVLYHKAYGKRALMPDPIDMT